MTPTPLSDLEVKVIDIKFSLKIFVYKYVDNAWTCLHEVLCITRHTPIMTEHCLCCSQAPVQVSYSVRHNSSSQSNKIIQNRTRFVIVLPIDWLLAYNPFGKVHNHFILRGFCHLLLWPGMIIYQPPFLTFKSDLKVNSTQNFWV